MADLWAQQYVAVEAIYASRFSTKFSIRLYTVKQNALGEWGGGGGAGGGGGSITQIAKSLLYLYDVRSLTKGVIDPTSSFEI